MGKFKRSADAYLQKLKPVFRFQNFYAQKESLLSEGFLEPETGKGILVKVFIDLTSDKSQPYIIFFDDKTLSFDLVSSPVTIEKIIDRHEELSDSRLLGVGSLRVEADKTFFTETEGENNPLAAALLWAANLSTNLKPNNGFEVLQTFLEPSLK